MMDRIPPKSGKPPIIHAQRTWTRVDTLKALATQILKVRVAAYKPEIEKMIKIYTSEKQSANLANLASLERTFEAAAKVLGRPVTNFDGLYGSDWKSSPFRVLTTFDLLVFSLAESPEAILRRIHDESSLFYKGWAPDRKLEKIALIFSPIQHRRYVLDSHLIHFHAHLSPKIIEGLILTAAIENWNLLIWTGWKDRTRNIKIAKLMLDRAKICEGKPFEVYGLNELFSFDKNGTLIGERPLNKDEKLNFWLPTRRIPSFPEETLMEVRDDLFEHLSKQAQARRFKDKPVLVANISRLERLGFKIEKVGNEDRLPFLLLNQAYLPEDLFVIEKALGSFPWASKIWPRTIKLLGAIPTQLYDAAEYQSAMLFLGISDMEFSPLLVEKLQRKETRAEGIELIRRTLALHVFENYLPLGEKRKYFLLLLAAAPDDLQPKDMLFLQQLKEQSSRVRVLEMPLSQIDAFIQNSLNGDFANFLGKEISRDNPRYDFFQTALDRLKSPAKASAGHTEWKQKQLDELRALLFPPAQPAKDDKLGLMLYSSAQFPPMANMFFRPDEEWAEQKKSFLALKEDIQLTALLEAIKILPQKENPYCRRAAKNFLDAVQSLSPQTAVNFIFEYRRFLMEILGAAPARQSLRFLKFMTGAFSADQISRLINEAILPEDYTQILEGIGRANRPDIDLEILRVSFNWSVKEKKFNERYALFSDHQKFVSTDILFEWQEKIKKFLDNIESVELRAAFIFANQWYFYLKQRDHLGLLTAAYHEIPVESTPVIWMVLGYLPDSMELTSDHLIYLFDYYSSRGSRVNIINSITSYLERHYDNPAKTAEFMRELEDFIMKQGRISSRHLLPELDPQAEAAAIIEHKDFLTNHLALQRSEQLKKAMQILGCEGSDKADDVRKLFRKLARTLHPDYAGDNPDYSTAFKLVKLAYNTWKDLIK